MYYNTATAHGTTAQQHPPRRLGWAALLLGLTYFFFLLLVLVLLFYYNPSFIPCWWHPVLSAVCCLSAVQISLV